MPTLNFTRTLFCFQQPQNEPITPLIGIVWESLFLFLGSTLYIICFMAGFRIFYFVFVAVVIWRAIVDAIMWNIIEKIW